MLKLNQPSTTKDGEVLVPVLIDGKIVQCINSEKKVIYKNINDFTDMPIKKATPPQEARVVTEVHRVQNFAITKIKEIVAKPLIFFAKVSNALIQISNKIKTNFNLSNVSKPIVINKDILFGKEVIIVKAKDLSFNYKDKSSDLNYNSGVNEGYDL